LTLTGPQEIKTDGDVKVTDVCESGVISTWEKIQEGSRSTLIRSVKNKNTS